MFAILCRNASDPAKWPQDLVDAQEHYLKPFLPPAEPHVSHEERGLAAALFVVLAASQDQARRIAENSPAAIARLWTDIEVAAFHGNASPPASEPPSGIPAISVVAMPADLNPGGAIFGGWLLAQMDQAAGIAAWRRARGRCVSVSMEGQFRRPVMSGDQVSLFASIEHVGRSSMTISVTGWRRPRTEETSEAVGDASFVYVAVDSEGRSRALDPQE